MSRPKALTKEQFLKAYAKNKSVVDLAIALGVCEMTVRNYLIAFGLNVTSTVEKKKLAVDVYNAYRDKASLTHLTKQFNCDLATIRYYIRRGMITIYSGKNPPKWPRPYLLSHIKIIHALEENPSLRRRTDKLAAKVKLSDECIAIYLNRLPTIKGKSK